MKRKIWTTAIASMVVLAMTVSALPVQVLKGLAGRSSVVNADDETEYVEIGTDAEIISSDILPCHHYYWNYGFSEQIYTASELGGITEISALSFLVEETGDGVNCEVYLIDTDQNAFSGSSIKLGDVKPVYKGPLDTSQEGWVRLVFSAPFTHKPEMNLMVAVVYSTDSVYYFSPEFGHYNDTDYCSVRYTTNEGWEYPNDLNNSALGHIKQKNCIRFYSFDVANVIYCANNGSGGEVICSYQSGDTAKITDPGFVCNGYTLSGWNTMADGSGDSYSLGDEFVLESDIELYAQWEITSEFSYDFETDPVADGWTFIDCDGDGFNWLWPSDPRFISHSGDNDGSVIISYSWYNNRILTPDNWAIAPAGIVDPDGTKTVTLWAEGNDSNYAAEHFAIYAQEVKNVDLDNFNPDAWVQISEEYVATGEYQMYSGDLSEFAGKAVYVAIRHFNVSDMYVLNIDDVVLPLLPMDPLGEVLEGYSVSLDGDIAVNFYMSLAADVVERGTAEMVFTVPNGEKTEKQVVKLSELGEPEEVNGKSYYVFKCKVSAKDMTSDITAQLVDGGLSGKEYTYSVKAYAEYLLNHPSNGAQTDLVKALLNYGAMAQTYFGVNPGNLANSSFSEEAEQKMSEITAGKISDYAVKEVDLPDDVVFEGATLSLKSETTLSLYFTSEEELAFECEDYPIEPVKVGNYQVVRIRGIKAWDLANEISVNVTSSEDGTVTYSPMTYCYNVLNGQYDGDLQNLCKALIMFYAGADALIHPVA